MPRKAARQEGIERDWEKRAQQLRNSASKESHGLARDQLLDQASRLDDACRMRDWLKPTAA